MNREDWSLLLEKLPANLWARNPPAALGRIRTMEALLGRSLPPAFRSFLRYSDGAQFGERIVLGTPEMLEFLQKGHPLPGLEGPSQELRKSSGLLPFHPVSRSSFECLDLRATGAPVVWVRFFQGERDPIQTSKDVTYVDFLDWFLDLLWGLHQTEHPSEPRKGAIHPFSENSPGAALP